METPSRLRSYDTGLDDGAPPPKRAKTLACMRCRRRKQKCDDQRPCANCSRSGEQCTEALSAYSSHPSLAPPEWNSYINSLEERISRLEETNTQSTVPVSDPQESSRRRVSFASRSSPAIGLLATFARSEDGHHSPVTPRDGAQDKWSLEQGTALDKPTQDALFNTYYDKVHCRYPFLRLDELRNVNTRPTEHWVGYFINMIFSIGILLEKKGTPSRNSLDQSFYRLAVTRYLSSVFAQQDRILHIQAYLLLAMHAIYSPSTERIISIASATMRYCVMAQLHLAEAEPDSADLAGKIEIQMRRRVFWSAYALDRAVGTMFDLPFSIPDFQITVKKYANIDDYELEESCARALPHDLQSRPSFTNLSAALHVVYCRQIQSEILNTTLHRDFGKQFDRLSSWRLRVLEKLDRWKSMCHQYSDTQSKNFTSSEWLHMIYNYSLAMLYQPTRATAAGAAGDWTVKSCVQACLIFRKFQRETAITELWLGLIAQFKCGVALIYCFFVTPPHLRSPAYTLPEVSEAVRACSVILSILAERWPQSKCLRDAFDILAKEIPLFEPVPLTNKRMGQESTETLLSLFGQLEIMVVHRNTLRMIKEMALDEFPRPLAGGQDAPAQMEAAVDIAHYGETNSDVTEDIFQPVMPYSALQDPVEVDLEGFDYTALAFPGHFDLGNPF